MRGQCRFCKCTQDDACRLEAGDTCCWMTPEQDLCSNPKCILAADVEKVRGRQSTEQTRRKEVKPIRELWRTSMQQRRDGNGKKRRRKTKGRAA